MGVGKYSPTVNYAYCRDQHWFERLESEEDWHDDEGYDSYGYHRDTRLDRAGYPERAYLISQELYESVLDDWVFDGIRPVEKQI